MENVIEVFSNPIVIVVICVAFGFPILVGILKAIQKKVTKKKGKNNANAQHVRDAVKKYEEKNGTGETDTEENE